MKINNKKRIHEIIFEADTTAGKVFDLSLIILILVSILIVMLVSIPPVHDKFRLPLRITEWVITFTQVCPNCMFGVHEDDALYCKKCGTKLDIT